METRISVDGIDEAAELFGSFDGNMRLIEQEYGVSVVFRDSELKITGEDPQKVDRAGRALKSLITLIGGGESLSEQNVRYCMSMVAEDSEEKVARLAGDCICITAKGKPIKPKTVGQRTYCDSIKGEHRHHRRGAGGHGEDVPGGGHGRDGF